MPAEKPTRALQAASPPRVAVLVDTSTSWGRRIVKGINSYTRKHGPWQIFVEARGIEERLRLPPGWQGDGVVARLSHAAMADELRALRIPVVNVSSIELPGPRFPRVVTDLQASARLAATHFLDRGFRHFAYFSLLGLSYVATHQAAFEQAVTEAGGDFASFAVKPVAGAEPDWNVDLAKLGEWLKTLPQPVGILTWNPSSAREIVYASQVASLFVPEQVAVLSGSDDDVLCELLQIPVSGILVAAEQIGFFAAQLLDRLMQGNPAPKEPTRLAPVGIITRQSTDTLAIKERPLVKALRFMHQNVNRVLRVEEVARHAGVSRRVLERQFMRILGRSPATELRRVHLERAKQLLVESDLAIPDVAEAAGYGSPEYLAYSFRRETGQTPLAYRREMRGR